MGDPQPRGFRQAPLKPSDIFFELDLVNNNNNNNMLAYKAPVCQKTFGRKLAVSHPENNAKSNR